MNTLKVYHHYSQEIFQELTGRNGVTWQSPLFSSILLFRLFFYSTLSSFCFSCFCLLYFFVCYVATMKSAKNRTDAIFSRTMSSIRWLTILRSEENSLIQFDRSEADPYLHSEEKTVVCANKLFEDRGLAQRLIRSFLEFEGLMRDYRYIVKNVTFVPCL